MDWGWFLILDAGLLIIATGAIVYLFFRDFRK
jgi:hypothetical protein